MLGGDGERGGHLAPCRSRDCLKSAGQAVGKFDTSYVTRHTSHVTRHTSHMPNLEPHIDVESRCRAHAVAAAAGHSMRNAVAGVGDANTIGKSISEQATATAQRDESFQTVKILHGKELNSSTGTWALFHLGCSGSHAASAASAAAAAAGAKRDDVCCSCAMIGMGEEGRGRWSKSCDS